MSDIADSLRATSDALMRDLEALNALEERKRALAPGDDRLLTLAQEIEAIAARLLGSSVRQRQLSERADTLVDDDHPEAPEQSIDATRREIHVILAEWREVERLGAEAPPDSAAARTAAERAAELREEYRRAHDAARGRTHNPDRPAGGGRG